MKESSCFNELFDHFFHLDRNSITAQGIKKDKAANPMDDEIKRFVGWRDFLDTLPDMDYALLCNAADMMDYARSMSNDGLIALLAFSLSLEDRIKNELDDRGIDYISND